jgi:site-specific DNA recombinase
VPCREFVEDYTGKTLLRPALSRLLEGIEHREISHVIVTQPDRLSRDLADGETLIRELSRKGIPVAFTRMRFDDSHYGDMQRQSFGMFAQFEWAQIRARTMLGRQRKIQAGQYAVRQAPYGYRRLSTGQLEIVPEQRAIVERIFTLILDQHLSLLKVCRILTAEGIATPTGGALWSRATIRKMVRNEAYCGVAWLNRTTRVKDQSVEQPRESWTPIQVPAIIPRARFARVGEILTANKRLFIGRPGSTVSLLRPYLHCACGARMQVYRRGQRDTRTPQYRCASRTTARYCGAPTWSIPSVDQAVWEAICAFLESPEVELAKRRALTMRQRRGHEEQVAQWQAVMKRARAEDGRWSDAYGAGKIDLEEFGRHKSRVRAMMHEASQHLARYTGLLQQIDPARIKAWLAANAQRVRQASHDERAALLRSILVRVELSTVSTKRAHVTLRPLPAAVTDEVAPTGEGGQMSTPSRRRTQFRHEASARFPETAPPVGVPLPPFDPVVSTVPLLSLTVPLPIARAR